MNDIEELFNKHPLTLTDSDLDELIKIERDARAKYMAGNKSAGSKKNVVAPTLSLADLGLGGPTTKTP